MTIKKLKEMIADLPDDMRIYADDSEYSIFGDDSSEYVCLAAGVMAGEDKMCVLQRKDDIDVQEELSAMADMADYYGWDELDYYMEALERGFTYEDFPDPEHAKEFMEDHGLI